MAKIKFDELKNHPRKPSYSGKINLDLAKKEFKFSYFNTKQKYIQFEILTSNKDFKLINVFYTIYNTEQFLIVHISDNTLIATRSLSSEYLMNINEEIKNIKNCTSNPISIPEVANVNVIVFNDTASVTCLNLEDIIAHYLKDKNPNNKYFTQPSESGGGVIVKGP